jgi:hypothetical protein
MHKGRKELEDSLCVSLCSFFKQTCIKGVALYRNAFAKLRRSKEGRK